MTEKFRQLGMSLLELVLTIALIAILAATSVYYVNDSVSAKRYEDTRTKMEALLTAIVGDHSVNNEGVRTNFGYHGDIGRIPTTLADLSAIGTQAAWAFDSTYGIGAGWRGPYIVYNFTGGQPLTSDEWGRAFIYDTGAFTVTSYAADNAAGGSVYNRDLVVNIPAALRLATVHGILLDSNSVVKGKTVTAAYPSNGAITTADATSDATTGTFSFSNIPFGLRSFKVTGTTQALGYKPLVIDKIQYYVPNSFLNFSADLQRVTGSGAVSTATANAVLGSRVRYNLDNSYETDLILNYITCWWTGSDAAFLKTVRIDATSVDLPNCLNSGQRSSALSTQTLGKNVTGKSFWLDFTTSDCTTGKAITSGVIINCLLEWNLPASNPDSVRFEVP